ncbi:MAG: hypothetical protein F6K65_21865 [Moorea sp. SIO3C2]|nr:hypothetical protein [Moorena sp. SIO3C2]
MGETTPVAHGGNPQDRTGSPRPRCIAFLYPTPKTQHPTPHTPHPTPYSQSG